MLYRAIEKLVEYGIKTGLTPECERVYATNLLLDVFGEEDYEQEVSQEAEAEKASECCGSGCNGAQAADDGGELEEILAVLLDEAVKRGIIEDSIVYRDLFDTKIMNCLVPRPAQVQKEFWEQYEKSPEKATEYFYKFSQDSDYIRRYRIKRDRKWKVKSPYGEIDITINLSKPEKDPKAIAAAGKAKASGYPKCQLCMENEGYAGRVNHPARETLRIIPITINESRWGFQYSPYVYYNEHCIVFNGEHVPMKNRQSGVCEAV